MPALAETVPVYDMGSWQGWFVPADVPGEIIARLNADGAKVLRMPAVRERLPSVGHERNRRHN